MAQKRSRLVEPVEPQMVGKNVEPVEPCSRCEQLENSISEFANLYYQEHDKVKEQKRIVYGLEKQIKDLEKQLRKVHQEKSE
jgi:hypothetical protein